MRVGFRLGAGLANLAGRPRLQLELPEGATVGDALGRLAEDYPPLAEGLGSTLPVVNGTQAEKTRALADGEEVALLLPVAGGAPSTEEETWRLR